jgi:hypothetical protein
MSWGEYKRLSDIAYDLGENRCMKLVHRKQYDRLAEEFVGYVEQNATDADPKDPAMMTVLGFATRHGREQ